MAFFKASFVRIKIKFHEEIDFRRSLVDFP